MPLPVRLARFNRRVTNPLLMPLVGRLGAFATIEHRGRTTGTIYCTPVNVFDCDDDLIVALTYGTHADWVKNVLAGGGTLVRQGCRLQIRQAVIVGREVGWPQMPVVVRGLLQLLGVHHFCRLSISPDTSQ